jgi:RHS repeat-associated protein
MLNQTRRLVNHRLFLRSLVSCVLVSVLVLQSLPVPVNAANPNNRVSKIHLLRTSTRPTPPDETIVVYGPRRFDRTGILTKATDQFTLASDALAPFNIKVQNGDPSGSGRVLIGTVRLNGSVVFSSTELNLQTPALTQPVTLLSQNTIEVTFFSRRASSLTITVTATKHTNATAPSISDFNPKNGIVGTPVTITGTNLTSNPGNPTVTFAGPNNTRLSAGITTATATQVVTTVPNGAVTGPIQLTTTGGTAQTSSAFTVNSQQDFQIVVSPATATAVQASTATLVVSVTSTQSNFTQLASLATTGLPAGVNVTFDPAQITAGAVSTLSLNLNNANLSSGSYSFTVNGTAAVEGNNVVRTAPATLVVTAAGQTTLSGRVLNTDKEPIMGATVSLDGKTATTDSAGSFLLSGVIAGAARPLMVDGRTASAPNRTYPVIAEPADVIAGQANVIPYNFYLPPIDVHTETEVVPGQMTMAANPDVPNLEMMIPSGANLRNRDNTPVTRVSITPLPIDRTPTPLPSNVGTSVVYTSQPGGAVADQAMPVIYPNLAGANPGMQVELYAFNHDTVQWYVYGVGRVSNDGRTIVPLTDPATGKPYGLRDFSWHFPNVTPPGKPKEAFAPESSTGPETCDGTSGSVGPHPVDLSTGLKIQKSTDISFGGTRGSISLTRITTSDLAGVCDLCPFGRGTTYNYAVRLSGSFVVGGAGRVLMPGETSGQLFSYTRTDADGSLVFTTVGTINQLGDSLKKLGGGTYEYRSKDGRVMRFDSSARLIALADANGNTTTLTYVGTNLTGITDAVGRSITLNYSGDRISQAIDPLGRIWKYTYDSGNRLVTVTDPEQNVTTYGYDFLSRVTSITDPRGNSVKSITYDGSGRVTQQVFADGGIEKYSYTLSGNTVTETTVTDPLGNKVTKRFSPNGYVIAETDELGQTVRVDRDIATNVAIATSGPCGCEEVNRQFDALGNLTLMTDRLGQHTIYQYEPLFSRVTSFTNPLGRITTNAYDSKGNLLSMTNALNQTTSFTYDEFGQMTKVTDPLGHVSRFEYDASGNLTASIDALGNRTSFEYDGIGRRTAVVDPLGRRTAFVYDGLSRITGITDPAGKTTIMSYDGNGNLSSVTNALNQKTKFSYNVKDLLVSTTDPLGRITRRQYNARDELISLTSPSGRLIKYQYDNRGQLTIVTDPLGNTINFAFDNKGNLSSLTDERGNKTTFIYDELSRLTQRIDPLGKSTFMSYDAASNMVERIDRLGRRTAISYDALNRPSQVTYTDPVVGYTYDAAGRLIRVDDTQSNPIERTYDDANRLLSEKTSAGMVTYAYNIASQRISMTAADRSPVSYTYDSAGRLKTIVQDAETFTYSYDALSRVAELQRPNGIKTTYSFDQAGELTRLLHANALNQAVEDFKYTFNSDGEIESIDSIASAQKLANTKTATPADAANRIAQFGQQSFVYDAEGQMTSKTDSQGITNFQWDARGRLTKATLPNNQQVSYGYDALGRRSSRTASGVTTSFLYDGADIVLDKASDGSAIDYLNGLGIDNKLRQTKVTSIYFLLDRLRSTAALTNANGEVIEREQYEAFGDTTGSLLTRYGYTGRERDDITRLTYYRERYYSTESGRFISEDPIHFLGGRNLYSYALNNPAIYTDPSGQVALLDDLILAGGGALVGLATQGVTDLLEGQRSDWQHYVGAAAGGAVGGLALEYTGGIGSGFASGFTTNAVTQWLEIRSGKQCEFDVEDLILDTGLGGLFGALPDLPIPKLSSGRNNWNAIGKSVRTKLSNETISNVSPKTAAKILVGSNVAGLNSTLAGIDATLIKHTITKRQDGKCGCQ